MWQTPFIGDQPSQGKTTAQYMENSSPERESKHLEANSQLRNIITQLRNASEWFH